MKARRLPELRSTRSIALTSTKAMQNVRGTVPACLICHNYRGWKSRRRLFPSRFPCRRRRFRAFRGRCFKLDRPPLPLFSASNFPAFSISAHIYMRVEKWKSGKTFFHGERGKTWKNGKNRGKLDFRALIKSFFHVENPIFHGPVEKRFSTFFHTDAYMLFQCTDQFLRWHCALPYNQTILG